jgi:pSer/pThr/pTyr-binding forkhead associated (FHA) protein
MLQIFVMNGPDKGRSFEFQKDTILIGRAPESDMQLQDKSVSRNHLKIEQKGQKYFITDLRSKNGTFIDGMPIEPQKAYEVKQGIPVAVGKTFIALGKSYPNDMLAVLDSIDLFKELDEDGGDIKDRPLTAKKNMELIYKVSNVLMQSLNIKEVLEKVLGYIMELLKRVDRGVVILVDKKTGNISEVISISKTLKDGAAKTHSKNTKNGEAKAYSRTIVERVLKERKPVSMLDTMSEDEAMLSESMRAMQIRSVMCVPLVSKSEVIGAIYVDSIKKPHGFRKEDLDLLTALSSPAALAIENSLLNR